MPSDKRARQRANRTAKAQARARRAKRRRLLIRGGVVVLVAGAVFGIAYAVEGGGSSKPTTPSTTTTTAAPTAAQKTANKVAVAAGCPADPYTRVNSLSWKSAPKMTIDSSKTYTAAVETDVGTFDIALDATSAPVTVNNFVFLAEHRYYRCVIFQRVIPGFMDQTGDPTGTGTGGPGYTIPDEYPKKAPDTSEQYSLGSVAMANSGEPHTGGSQWFVVAGAEGESLPPTYSVLGQVTSGMSVVDAINDDGNSQATSNGIPPKVIHRILSVTIHES